MTQKILIMPKDTSEEKRLEIMLLIYFEILLLR